MALDSLKKNIAKEESIIKELLYFTNYLNKSISGRERSLIKKTISSLLNLLKIINNSIPRLIENISVTPKLPAPSLKKEKPKEKIDGLIKLKYPPRSPEKQIKEEITLREKDKKKFIKELQLSSELIRKIKKKKPSKKDGIGGWTFQKPGFYARLSNILFRGLSNSLIKKGHFAKLNSNLRKSNSRYLVSTYVSMMFFTILLSFIISLALFGMLYLSGLITIESGYLIYGIVSVFLVPLVAGVLFYISPATEVSSMKKKISREIPFVTIHMAAVAGADIEPSKVFSVIVESNEYPYTRKELMKVINQTNFYGYDLVNSLKNTAKTTSSEKLAELFNGLASTISSGGSLKAFLENRAEGMLFDYRLERERYSRTAENFMNIYIAIVIAAPMIFLLLFILLSISGTGAGFGTLELSLMIISAVAFINILFLIFLHIKQPRF